MLSAVICIFPSRRSSKPVFFFVLCVTLCSEFLFLEIRKKKLHYMEKNGSCLWMHRLTSCKWRRISELSPVTNIQSSKKVFMGKNEKIYTSNFECWSEKYICTVVAVVETLSSDAPLWWQRGTIQSFLNLSNCNYCHIRMLRTMTCIMLKCCSLQNGKNKINEIPSLLSDVTCRAEYIF